MLVIRPAIYSDLDAIAGILREAAQWLLGRGIAQWKPEHIVERDIAHAIARGEFFVAEIDGQAAGTFKLQQGDPAVWPEAAEDALYLHALAIRRAHAGRGLGLILLDWASARAAEAGRQYLRLDCMAENEALCDYYRKAGFTEHGIQEAYSHRLDVHWRARKFQRIANCKLQIENAHQRLKSRQRDLRCTSADPPGPKGAPAPGRRGLLRNNT